MSERLEEPNGNCKGLVPIQVGSLEDERTWIVGVAFKSKQTDRGLMLNVCPWCSEAIVWDEKHGGGGIEVR